MSKILITGAAGFVGSHLVEYLLSQGVKRKDLRLFIKKRESLKNLPDVDFDIIESDVRNKNAVKKAVEDVDVIYHLAAITVFDGKTYEDYKVVNVDGTQNLIDAVKNNRIKKFVFFSSIAVFGLPAYVGEIINWNENQPKRYAEDYGKSKYEGERRILKAHEEHGFPYVIIRPTTVYGPRDKLNLFELYKAIKGHYFFFIGDGKNKMDYVFVRDLVRGARQAELSKIKAADYILGGGKPISFKNVVKFVSKSIDVPVPNIHIPKQLGLGASYMIESMGRFIGIRFPLFPTRVKVMTTHCYFDISKAKKEISYNPSTSFKEGTQITGKWFLER
jgi:nucleoside-diphosphate-sugar epimerase